MFIPVLAHEIFLGVGEPIMTHGILFVSLFSTSVTVTLTSRLGCVISVLRDSAHGLIGGPMNMTVPRVNFLQCIDGDDYLNDSNFIQR